MSPIQSATRETLVVMADLLEQWRDPVFNERHTQVPVALATRLTEMAEEIPRSKIYYERKHVLLAVAAAARKTDPATFAADGPPSDAEQELGTVLGQAFHQGCPLADVALAAGLHPDHVVAIGKRTIRRTGWLKHL
jgi:hypothetical protein